MDNLLINRKKARRLTRGLRYFYELDEKLWGIYIAGPVEISENGLSPKIICPSGISVKTPVSVFTVQAVEVVPPSPAGAIA